MLEAGKTYNYFWSDDKNDRGTDVLIERVEDGIAYATSEAFGDLGPFTMKFDAMTGKGIGEYSHAHLKMEKSADELRELILSRVEGYESSDKTAMIQDLLLLASTDALETISKKQGI